MVVAVSNSVIAHWQIFMKERLGDLLQLMLPHVESM
jgi:hypothetical protein